MYTNEEAILLLHEIIPKMASSHFRNLEKNISEKMVPGKKFCQFQIKYYPSFCNYHICALQNGMWNINCNPPHSNQNGTEQTGT